MKKTNYKICLRLIKTERLCFILFFFIFYYRCIWWFVFVFIVCTVFLKIFHMFLQWKYVCKLQNHCNLFNSLLMVVAPVLLTKLYFYSDPHFWANISSQWEMAKFCHSQSRKESWWKFYIITCIELWLPLSNKSHF